MMLLTSNRSVAKWGSISGDTMGVPAILDYLPHHSHVGTICGDSYHPREKCRLRLLPKQRKEAAATASM
jgi:DNA replication protein DnaC